MLIVNLLNGVLLASLVCFAVGAVSLLILVASAPAEAPKSFPSRVQAAFRDPRFRIANTLITAGGVVAVASFVAVFVLSASLPKCPDTADDIDEAVAMCMPVAPTTSPSA